MTQDALKYLIAIGFALLVAAGIYGLTVLDKKQSGFNRAKQRQNKLEQKLDEQWNERIHSRGSM